MTKMTRKQRAGSGTFRFDGSEIAAENRSSRREIKRIARQLAAPPGRPRRCYGRAKLLTVEQIRRVIAYLQETSRVPESDILKVRLSFYAGLRASEIAQLTVDHVTNASGGVGKHIIVTNNIAKGGRGRSVPMNPFVAEAIEKFRKAYPTSQFLAISSREGRTQSPGAMAAWFWHMYKRVGYQGVSSHSGRRWYITEMARSANRHGASLADVQNIAGHARIDSTQCYIELSDQVFDMVNSLGEDPKPGSFGHRRAA